MSDRRLGKFYVKYEYLKDKAYNAAAVFSMLRFIPYRAELLAHTDEVEYIGWSPMFDLIPFGEKVPLYTIEVTMDKNSEVNVKVVKNE